MTSSAQLEREAEQTRSELARTLDELRGRLTPGQLLDEALDYAEAATGGEFVRNLSRQVAANPLPVVLIGTGISWLALAKRNSGAVGENAGAAAHQASDLAASLGESAQDAATRLTDASSGVSEGAASAYGSMKSGASSAATTAGNMAADAYGRMTATADQAGSAIAQSTRDFGQKATSFGNDAIAFCKERPVVLAGVGLALGAVLGAILPSTEAEDRLIGGASDRIKDQASSAVEEQIDQVETAAEKDMDRATTLAEGLPSSEGEATGTTLVPEDEDATAKLPME